jgi:hypothetical protein
MLSTKISSTAIALIASASLAFAGPLAPVASAQKNNGTYQKTVGKLKQAKAESPCPGFQRAWENSVLEAESDAEAGDQESFELDIKTARETEKNAKDAGCSIA